MSKSKKELIVGSTLETIMDLKPTGAPIKTLNQVSEAQRITKEIIENLDDAAIGQLYQGSERDIERLLASLQSEVYDTLYGTQFNLEGTSVTGYIDNLTSTTEETLRIEHFPYFITSALPEFDLNWHHVEWAYMCQLHRKLCVIAARDHGKSYFFSMAYLIWMMYRFRPMKSYLKTGRKDLAISERGVLMTNEKSLANELMEIMKDVIENNSLLREKLYPDSSSRNWAIERIKCKNGARLQTKSYGTKFRGRHPGYLVADDFLDDSALYSADQRNKFINYFHSVIMNAVRKDGRVVVVGTPFHENDLYGDLKKKKNWRVFEYPSIYPDGRVLWSNKYTINELLEKRDDQGSLIFSREHLVKPILSDASIFPYNLVKKAFRGMEDYTLVKSRDNFPVKFPFVVTGCDFAISSSVGADYTVFMTWGVELDGTMWLMHMWRGKGKSYGEQIAVLKAINRNFRPDVMYVESNQFQIIFAESASEAGIPVVPHHTSTNKHSLEKGLPSLALYFERNRIKFPRGDQRSKDMTDLICSELTSVAWTDKGLQGVGEHDDCPMTMWQSSLAAKHVVTGFGVAHL